MTRDELREKIRDVFFVAINKFRQEGMTDSHRFADSVLALIDDEYEPIFSDVSKVYCNITNGKISKPNTCAEDVIAVMEDCVNELVEKSIKEHDQSRPTKTREKWLDELCIFLQAANLKSFKERVDVTKVMLDSIMAAQGGKPCDPQK